jgi:hypothetical protein
VSRANPSKGGDAKPPVHGPIESAGDSGVATREIQASRRAFPFLSSIRPDTAVVAVSGEIDMTSKQRSAIADHAKPAATAGPAPSTAAGPYVLNLCSANTPMSLQQVQIPALARFTFFMSRRLEDGRERFRLHMGYFTTLAEAQEWLPVVREVFPSAWVGEMPGKRLPQVARAAGRLPSAPATQTVGAAPAAAPVERAPARAAATQASAVAQPASLPAEASRVPPPASTAAAMPAAPAPGSNIREVLEQLDSGSVPRSASRAGAAAAEDYLSDSQVLRTLEGRHLGGDVSPPGRDVESVPLLKPDDTGTRRALRDAVASSLPVSFSVQLHWSVQPIDLSKVPPLAIFSAYTLYTVEGSREGRKWYGLRLGFFTNAIAAKQVAHYVRSEFASVAIVPVSAKEKDRALGGQPRPVGTRAPLAAKKTDLELGESFRLIDEPPRQPPRDLDDFSPAAALAAAASPKPPAGKPAGPAAGAPAGAAEHDASRPRPGAARVRANSRRPPETLEETLEILGASALQMQVEDQNRRGGVRVSRVEPPKGSPFTRLMDRLADRLNKG